MILFITNKCRMGCTHCLNNCELKGEDMPFETLKDTVAYIKKEKLRIRTVIISGGEPCDHPDLFRMLDILAKELRVNAYGKPVAVTLATNGMFLTPKKGKTTNEQIKAFSDKLLSYENLSIQITNDTRFYPGKLHASNLNYLLETGGEK